MDLYGIIYVLETLRFDNLVAADDNTKNKKLQRQIQCPEDMAQTNPYLIIILWNRCNNKYRHLRFEQFHGQGPLAIFY